MITTLGPRSARAGFLCLLLGAGCAHSATVGDPPGRTGPPALQQFHDLAEIGSGSSIPLIDEAVRGVSLVGLGESVHGSSGYHAARLEFVKYLVTNHGFRAILLETPIDDANAAGKYVLLGQGDPSAAVRPWYPLWQSVEQVRLLEWLRAFNTAHPQDPARFSGFDIRQGHVDMRFFRTSLQSEPTGPRRDALARVLSSCPVPEDGKAFFALEQECWAHKPCLPEPGRGACLAALDELERLSVSREADAGRRADLAWSLVHVNSLRSWMAMMAGVATGVPRAGDTERDRGLAYNVLKVPEALSETGTAPRTIYIAHDAHVAKGYRRLESSEPGIKNYVTMGELLKERLGSGYLAVGLLAYDVGIFFNYGQKEPLWFREGPDTLEAQLNGLPEPIILLSPAGSPPSLPTRDRAFATMFREDGPEGEPVYFRGDVGDQFDLVLFMRRSEPLHPVPRPAQAVTP
jgi:erythromycin esterase